MMHKYSTEIVRKKSAILLQSPFLRFILVGAFNTMLAYVVYALALAIGFLYPMANFIALVTGIIIGFKTQGKFVFYCSDYQRFWRFLFSWMLIYCANVSIIGKLIYLEYNPYVAGALALPIVTILSFISQKYWVFMKKKVVCSNSSNENDNHKGQ